MQRVARWVLGKRQNGRALAAEVAFVAIYTLLVTGARASDHLDSPATVANPQADIGDVYAWTAPDGGRLNLVMTVQGHTFSDKIQYAIHIDSGAVFGHTTASTTIECLFDSPRAVTCRLGDVDSVSGDPSVLSGIEGKHHRFRVYAGLRDDPFYNNVKGLLGAYETANAAIKNGAAMDAAGCGHFDETTTKSILGQMVRTDGGPAQNFLRNWTVSAIVVSVDLNVVSRGGNLLAVWGTTSLNGKQIDHMGRPFLTNTLLGAAPFSADDASGQLRQKFNEASPAYWSGFAAEIRKSLAFQDSLDGECGNQLLAESAQLGSRYSKLADTLADDRLWVDAASRVCTQFFAVEIESLADGKKRRGDCGGRAPTYDAPNAWRSLLIAGRTAGVSDGLHEDEHPPSATTFPFLAPPDPNGVDH